ncbi:hypothetical protein HG530_002631 [Fusarium avenaceum]|nr:hypothetical protein HG530_002631 [Fusarium avenaceum]
MLQMRFAAPVRECRDLAVKAQFLKRIEEDSSALFLLHLHDQGVNIHTVGDSDEGALDATEAASSANGGVLTFASGAKTFLSLVIVSSDTENHSVDDNLSSLDNGADVIRIGESLSCRDTELFSHLLHLVNDLFDVDVHDSA